MVEKHGKTWRYDFLKDGVRYKKGGFKTKGEAIQAEAEARTGAKSINTDFLKLCNSRLEEVELRRSKKHFKENKALFTELLQEWGTFPQISQDDIHDFLNKVALRSKNLANKKLRLIKALFNHGIKRRWFLMNPASGIDFFGIEKKRKYIPPDEDIEKVIASATHEQRQYLLTIIYTLARVSEINRLKWQDVDLTNRFLILRTRKAKNSNLTERKIPINNILYEILSSLPVNGVYVFINPGTQKPYDYRRRFLKTLCKNCKVPIFTYHCLRHYGASKLANQGVAITDIQEILGHQETTTTSIYLQSLRGSVVEALQKLEVIPPKIPPSDEDVPPA